MRFPLALLPVLALALPVMGQGTNPVQPFPMPKAKLTATNVASGGSVSLTNITPTITFTVTAPGFSNSQTLAAANVTIPFTGTTNGVTVQNIRLKASSGGNSSSIIYPMVVGMAPTNTAIGSLLFDGTQNYAEAAITNLVLGTNWTVESWGKAADWVGAGYAGLFGTVANSQVAIGFIPASSQMQVNVTNVEFYPSITFATNEWQHFAVDYDGAIIRAYFNGTCVGSNIVALDSLVVNDAFRIGEFTAGVGFFNGKISQVRISDSTRYGGDFVTNGVLALDANALVLWRTADTNGGVTTAVGAYGVDATLQGTPAPELSTDKP